MRTIQVGRENRRSKQSQYIMLLAVVMSAMFSLDATGRTWRVPGDAPTIQAGVSLAQPGDDVLVAPGTYFECDITMRPGVWLHSEDGPNATVVDAGARGRIFYCHNLTATTIIEGFKMRDGYVSGGNAQGGGIHSYLSNLVIRDCVITGCYADADGGGIAASSSSILLERCAITDCEADYNGGGFFLELNTEVSIVGCTIDGNTGGADIGGGAVEAGRITIIGTTISRNAAEWGGGAGIICISEDLLVRNCEIRENLGAIGSVGLGLSGSVGLVSSCTVVDNGHWLDGTGISIGGHSSIEVERTVIAYNKGRGMSCGYGSQVRVRCCDIYGNEDGDDICGEDLSGNFSADPLFCDAANGDYTLDWASPCLPGNHPNGVDCGLIGALGAGCGTPPVTGACCFADDTCVVAEPQDCASQGGSHLGDDTDCDPNPCIPTPTEISTWGRIRHGYR